LVACRDESWHAFALGVTELVVLDDATDSTIFSDHPGSLCPQGEQFLAEVFQCPDLLLDSLQLRLGVEAQLGSELSNAELSWLCSGHSDAPSTF
jgi:hypothetical protein